LSNYPASWQIAQLRAFPEPPGKAPSGIWIAFRQSSLSIKPFTTYSHNKEWMASVCWKISILSISIYVRRWHFRSLGSRKYWQGATKQKRTPNTT